MIARGGKALVVLALVLATGLHWAALQTVAWTTMLAGHLRGDSLAQAVSKTFDGRHPCCLCKAIAAAKKSEKKSETVSPALKMEFPPVGGSLVLIPPAKLALVSRSDTIAESRAAKPPLPPPRSFPG